MIIDTQRRKTTENVWALDSTMINGRGHRPAARNHD